MPKNQKFVAIGAAIALSIPSFSPPVKANPAVLAPAAFCAGTAGVGCVLVVVATIGGTAYYVWQLSDGRRVHATASGRILSSEYLEDPEMEGEVWDEPIHAKTKPLAQKQCDRLAKQYKVTLVGVSHNGKSFVCTFRA
ncbi:hypothetical protein [Aulosira sp. FACHB-615]|uniref:hypothetical protein n=1 Tax=Aulosira sp. FACHB-615 TaxID=2692777 RepID=UPI00168362BF|nr:hypothetical protein [Aulosira sp. FACHB-615]MBD2492525.1 hypothetical protein [Aulosira sp. FACHB-615]